MSHSGIIRYVLISNNNAIKLARPCIQTQLQFVRWLRQPHKRKPFFLGTAKSKLTRFPNWEPYKLGEGEEMKKLTCDYRHMMKSLFAHFQREYAKISETSHIAAAKQKADEEEHIRLMEENRLENERLAKIRDVRVAAEELAKQERLIRNIARAETRSKVLMEEAEDTVRRVNEWVKNCITPETLDAAIDEALDNEVDYNFAIDLDGNVYRGRFTNKLETTTKTEMQA